MASLKYDCTTNGDGASEEPCLRVLQITDTHLYSELDSRLAGVNTERSWQDVMGKVLDDQWPAELVLATGDIVHDGSHEAYRRFKQQFETLGVPTRVIPGNHDLPAVLREVMQGGLVTAETHYVKGNWQFVMLDSTVEDSVGGHLAPDQLALLDDCLSRYPNHHAVVCLHHHPVPVDCDWIDPIGVDNGEELFAVTDRHANVRAVIWGHIHQAFQAERKGVQLLASPSTCIQFKPHEHDFALDTAPPGFRWLRLFADGRIETGVDRVKTMPNDLDVSCAGY